MKRHEACYWLNHIIGDLRRRKDDYAQLLEKTDPAHDERGMAEFYHKEIAEISLKLEALDIAADSLTKGR